MFLPRLGYNLAPHSYACITLSPMPEGGFLPAQNTEGADARTELWDWLSCRQRRSPDPVPAPGLHLISPPSLL